MAHTTLVDDNVSYENMGHYSTQELNDLLTIAYNNDLNLLRSQNQYVDQTIDTTRYGATNGVTLYKVYYNVTVPETGKVEEVSGLVAIPDGIGGSAPVVSYQHGTILDTVSVPSNVIKKDSAGNLSYGSGETLVNLARFAGNGYILSAADYLGKGISGQSNTGLASTVQEAYAVKDATNQTNVNMLWAANKLLDYLNLSPDKIFLNGWSQGGLNTQWLAQALEGMSVPISATAAASPFNDLVSSVQAWTSPERSQPNNPYDPVAWSPPTVAMALASYESYYKIDGLLNAAIKPQYLDQIKAYLNNNYYYDWTTATNAEWPVNSQYITNGVTSVPGLTSREMVVDGFFSGYTSPQAAEFFKQLQKNNAYDWTYATPVRLYFGTTDEALPASIVTKPLALGGTNISSQEVKLGSHRGTFLYSLFSNNSSPTSPINSYDWFNSLKSVQSNALHLVNSSNQLSVSGDSYGIISLNISAAITRSSKTNIVEVYRVAGDPSKGGSKSYIGSLGTVKGKNIVTGKIDALLQAGDRLQFQSGQTDSPKDIIDAKITQTSTGYQAILNSHKGTRVTNLRINIVQTDVPNTLDQKIASAQGAPNLDILNLAAGDSVNIKYQNSKNYRNNIGLVQIDQDPTTKLPLGTVAGVAPNSASFADAVKSHFVTSFPSIAVKSGGGGNVYWTAPTDGVYAIVATDSRGNIYTYGEQSYLDKRSHVLNIGDNAFGFETSYGKKYDGKFNDFTVQISGNVNINKLIYGLYNSAYNRDPSTTELTNSINSAYQEQLTPNEIVGNFINSTEYLANYGIDISNDEFAAKLDQYTFDRSPDVANVASLVNQLNSGDTRNEVLLSLVKSDQAMQYVQSQHPTQPWIV